MLIIYLFNLSYVSGYRYIATPDFHVKVSDHPAVVCFTSLQPQ